MEFQENYLKIYQDTSKKSLKTKESGATHYNGLNPTYWAGGKSRYKWFLLGLSRNIKDGSCSRIKSKLFTVHYLRK